MDDLKDLLKILPEEPEKKLRDWAFLNNEDLLGGELCLFRRESVELYPEDQGWPLPAPEGAQNKRVWGARCTCTACGEDFIAGYGSAKQGGMQIKGIRLLCGDDGQLWPGVPDKDEMPEAVADIAEGEALRCPYCGAEVRLIHAGSLRGGRTWQLLLCQAAVLAGRLVLLYWMARRTADDCGCFDCSLRPWEAVVLDRDGRLRRITHVFRGMYGAKPAPAWRLCGRFRAPEELRYYSWDADNHQQIGARVFSHVPDLTGTTGEKTGIEDYVRSGGTWCAAYLGLWRRHPNAENLARRGWGRILEDELGRKAANNVQTGRTEAPPMLSVNWEAGKPHEMLGMDRASCKVLAGRWGYDQLKLWGEYTTAYRDVTAQEFAAANHVADLSSRELEKLIRERDAAQEETAQAEAARDETARRLAAALEAQEDAAKVGAAQRSRAEVAEAKAKELEDKLDKAKTKYKLARQELRQLQENPTIPQDAMDKLRREAEEQAAKEAAEKAEARQAELRAARDKANEDAYNAREVARQAEKDRDEARRRLALANPDAAVFAALYGQVQEDWNKLHGAWIKAEAADAATGEKLRTAARALAEKWRKEEW